MKHSIASVCLSGNLKQKIEAAAAAGFRGIEIFENDLLLYDASPAVVRRIAEDNNIDIIALQPFRDFECMPRQNMKKNYDRAERKFDTMAELNTDTLLICSNVSPACVDNPALAAEQFNRLADSAASRGIRLGYEALAWGRYTANFTAAWDIVKQADHPNLGIILDSFHIFARGRDLSAIAEIPGDKITLVQIADAPWLKLDVLQWSRHFRCFPGQGQFPVVEFMQEVAKTGYDGYVSHEIFNDEFRSTPTQDTALDGKRSLLWLENEMAGRAPDIVAPEIAEKAKAPPQASVTDVEFIEFATAGSARDTFLELISALGFQQTHQHNSKDVALFRCQNVNFILNQEPDSFAQNHFLVHGTSVCAVGYRTDNAQNMVSRASYFKYSRFETEARPQEMQIPGIRGMNGELVYFVESPDKHRRFYDVDFIPLETSAPACQAPMRVDHITSGISESEFLSTSLFYRVLFGLNVDQPQDLIDPYGLIVSRTATSQNKKIRLPFNMSRSGNSSTEQFRRRHGGSGVQHIAIHCDDILSYIEHVDQKYILDIPENYYDDLEARFDLTPELSQKMRQYNLLYDESPTGYFLHCYTIDVNGLFFEIVQRHQYGNYGEANAHVRIAAQTRARMKLAAPE